MLRIVSLAAVFALTLTSTAGFAQTMEATPIPLSPKPDLSPLSYFVGTWSCAFRSARRPTPQYTTTVATLDPGGRWLTEKSSTKPVSWFPYAVTEVDQITYDTNSKRWVDVETDSLGGYDLSASSGWNGNAMVWKDLSFVAARDVVSATNTTLKKVSPTKFTSTNSFTTTKGRVVATTTVCTKT